MGDTLVVGKTIRMPCMRKGLCKYPDTTILLGNEVLASMAKTAHGIPVTIEHPDMPINENTMNKIKIAGRVAGMDYSAETDEWFANFICDSAEGVDLLKKGYGVSTGWYGDKYGPGGTYNGVEYQQELKSARYEHLAIVRNPRYEMAVDPIFLNSQSDSCKKQDNTGTIVSKQPPTEKKLMFKLFRNRREDIKLNEGEDVLVDMEGDEKPLAEVVAEYLEIKKASAKKNTKILSGDELVDVEGEKIAVKDLIAAVKGARKDAAAPAETVGFKEEDKVAMAASADADKDDATKENEATKEEPKSKDEDAEKARVNENFNDLKNIRENSSAEISDEYVSSRERVDMGKARYGSPKK